MLSAAVTDGVSHFQAAESTAEVRSCCLHSHTPVAKSLLHLHVPHSNLTELQGLLVHHLLLVSQLFFHWHVADSPKPLLLLQPRKAVPRLPSLALPGCSNHPPSTTPSGTGLFLHPFPPLPKE